MIRGIAHRGYSAKYTENTLTALQAAVDLEYSHVEFDVQLSADGVPVLMHDFSVQRLTGAPQRVVDLTLAELKALTLPQDEQIATLEEALNLLQGRITAMVEVKQAGTLYPGLEEKTLDLLRSTDTFDQSIIISFDHFSIAKLRELDPDVRLGLTSSCSMPYVFDFMAQLGCDHLGVPTAMLTPEYAQMMTDRGISIGPWMVDSLESMEMIASQYPTALITTNECERWADFYRSHPEVQGHLSR